MSVIPTLGRLRQEDHEFETNLGYIARTCLKKAKGKERKRIENRGQEGKICPI
jgi:hypothetical protein